MSQSSNHTERTKICFVATVPMAVSAFLNPHMQHLSNDFQVYIVANYDGKMPASVDHVIYLDVPLARKISILADLKALFVLFRIFKSHGFDSVHTVTPKAGLLGMLAAWLASVPVRIHWFTGQVWATKKGLARFMLKAADRVIVACATHLLADSPSQRDFLIHEKICSANRIDVIGDGSICGVDSNRFRPDQTVRARIRTLHDIPARAKVVLFLGRMNIDKGLRELAQAMQLVQKQHHETHWLFVGPDEGDMVHLIHTSSGTFADQVHIQGFTDTPENYMAAADIFCLPSYREGFGSSVIEAAATGIPTVASAIYGLTDAVVDGVTGILVAPAKADALADALTRLLEDDARRLAMGQAARERALDLFSRERIVTGLHEFYLKLLASPKV